MIRNILTVTALSACFLLPSLASAEPLQAPGPAVSDPAFAAHDGTMVGVGVGIGAVCFDLCQERITAPSFDFSVGVFLNPRTAVMYDLVAGGDRIQGVLAMVSLNTAAVQYWVAPKFSVKAGAGVGFLVATEEDGSSTDTGQAFIAAASYELSRTGNVVIDVSARVSHLSDSWDFDGLTFVHALVGFRWR